VAAHYRETHLHTAVVELDSLRPTLDGGTGTDGAKREARRRGLELTATHLQAGDDVVVPQFLGRQAYVDDLATVAEQHGAQFIHVVLTADPSVVIDRFQARRSELRTNSQLHPEDEVADEDIDSTITEAVERIDNLCDALRGVARIRADGSATVTAQALSTAVYRTSRGLGEP
jgi:predicted kinase